MQNSGLRIQFAGHSPGSTPSIYPNGRRSPSDPIRATIHKQPTEPMTDLQTRCLTLAEELSDFGIDRVDQRDLDLAFEGLTESNLYATAEAIAWLGDWFN